MSVGHLFQGDTRLERRRVVLVGLHRGHEAPSLLLCFEHLAACLEVGVELGQTVPEVVDGTLEVAVGHEQVLLYVVLLYLVASLAGEDDELAYDVRATEVDAWVGLAVALLLGAAYGLGERHVGGNLVEDEVQRAAEDGFYLQYLVARVAEVVDGAYDGQSGAHVGLVAEPDALVACRLLQLHVAVVVARGSYLVGCHDADVVLEEGLVELCYLSAGRAVYEDGVEDVHLHNLVAHLLGVGRVASAQRLLVVVEVDAVAVEHEVLDVGDAHHVQLQSARLHEELLLGAYLFEQHASHCADAADEDVQYLVFGEEERVV